MVVVDQVLVVGVGVNRLDVTVLDTVLIVNGLEHRCDGVGGTGCSRQNPVFTGDPVVVNPVHNILDVTFTRRCQQNPADPLGFQVQTKPGLVAPDTCVVNNNRIVNAVLGVIHLIRARRVDHLDKVAIGDQRRVFFVHGDRTVEGAVNRIAAQQAGALFEVIVCPTLTNHDGTQTQVVTATGLLDHDPGQQPPDPPETVKHHVFGVVFGIFLRLGLILADNRANLTLEKVIKRSAFFLEFHRELADIHVPATQLHLVHCLQNRQGVVNRQLAVFNLTHKAVRANDVDDRLVDNGPAIHRRDHIVFTVETADQRNHGFRSGFSFRPVRQVLIDLFVTHA